MTIEEVKKEVLRIIKESTETELKVTEETSLFADMGLASVEVVVMVGELEETFGKRSRNDFKIQDSGKNKRNVNRMARRLRRIKKKVIA